VDMKKRLMDKAQTALNSPYIPASNTYAASFTVVHPHEDRERVAVYERYSGLQQQLPVSNKNLKQIAEGEYLLSYIHSCAYECILPVFNVLTSVNAELTDCESSSETRSLDGAMRQLHSLEQLLTTIKSAQQGSPDLWPDVIHKHIRMFLAVSAAQIHLLGTLLYNTAFCIDELYRFESCNGSSVCHAVYPTDGETKVSTHAW
jgi:hypothetical protein